MKDGEGNVRLRECDVEVMVGLPGCEVEWM